MGHERLSENVCWNIILTGVSGKYQSLVIIKEANTHRQPPLITLARLHPYSFSSSVRNAEGSGCWGRGRRGGRFPMEIHPSDVPTSQNQTGFPKPFQLYGHGVSKGMPNFVDWILYLFWSDQHPTQANTWLHKPRRNCCLSNHI